MHFKDIEVDKETFEKFLQTYPNILYKERYNKKVDGELGLMVQYYDDNIIKYGYVACYFATDTKTTYYILNYFYDKRRETNGK